MAGKSERLYALFSAPSRSKQVKEHPSLKIELDRRELCAPGLTWARRASISALAARTSGELTRLWQTVRLGMSTKLSCARGVREVRGGQAFAAEGRDLRDFQALLVISSFRTPGRRLPRVRRGRELGPLALFIQRRLGLSDGFHSDWIKA